MAEPHDLLVVGRSAETVDETHVRVQGGAEGERQGRLAGLRVQRRQPALRILAPAPLVPQQPPGLGVGLRAAGPEGDEPPQPDDPSSLGDGRRDPVGQVVQDLLLPLAEPGQRGVGGEPAEQDVVAVTEGQHPPPAGARGPQARHPGPELRPRRVGGLPHLLPVRTDACGDRGQPLRLRDHPLQARPLVPVHHRRA